MSPLAEASQGASSRGRVLPSRSVALCIYVTLAAGTHSIRWEARGTDTLYVWLARKVAIESSSSVHHGVWWTGAMVPVQGEEKARSRYPVMLAILSCSQSLKCARVKSTS